MFLQVVTLDNVMQGILIGFIIAVLAVAYNKLVIGRFVKALIKAEAVHPVFAKSFEQLNVKKSFMLSYALRSRGTLRKYVSELNDENKGSYYIPEDRLYRAGRIYGGKDVDILVVSASIIILLIFFVIAIACMPLILDQVNNMFGTGV